MMKNILSRIKKSFQFSKEGLSFSEKLVLCLPAQALSLSSVLIHNVYIKFYTDLIGLKPTYVSLIYFIFNVWNMLNDPVFGIFLDKMKYKRKRGKYVYVMRVTIPLMILMLIGMLFAQPAWDDVVIFWVLLGSLFLYDTAATFFGISAGCFVLLSAPSKEERVDISVIGGYVANIVSFFATLIPTMLLVGDTKNNRGLVITLLLCVVAMNAFLYIFAAFKLKDKEELYRLGDSSAVPFNPKTLWQDVKGIMKMRAFWTTFFFRATAFAPSGAFFTAFLFYMDYVIKSTGFQATLVDVLPMLVVFAIYPVIGNYVKKKGIKKSVLFSMLPYLIGYIVLLFTNNWVLALFAYIPIMFTKTLSGTANSIMQATMIDENEEQTGIRKPGLFGSIEAILNAPLAGIQLVLFTTIIERFGYQEGGGIQTANAVLGIRIATAGVPILFCLLGIIPLLLYPYSAQRENELSEYSKKRRHPSEEA